MLASHVRVVDVILIKLESGCSIYDCRCHDSLKSLVCTGFVISMSLNRGSRPLLYKRLELDLLHIVNKQEAPRVSDPQPSLEGLSRRTSESWGPDRCYIMCGREYEALPHTLPHCRVVLIAFPCAFVASQGILPLLPTGIWSV